MVGAKKKAGALSKVSRIAHTLTTHSHLIRVPCHLSHVTPDPLHRRRTWLATTNKSDSFDTRVKIPVEDQMDEVESHACSSMITQQLMASGKRNDALMRLAYSASLFSFRFHFRLLLRLFAFQISSVYAQHNNNNKRGVNSNSKGQIRHLFDQ